MFVNSRRFTSVILVSFLVLNPIQSGGTPYSVPEPRIEVFQKGFRFSIPHEEGIELFAFHGNINRPMHGIEAGRFSKDIIKKCEDFWVFEDTSQKMTIGDSIYYWLFVIKDRLGYRYDDGHFVVKEIAEYTPLPCEQSPTHPPWIVPTNEPTDGQAEDKVHETTELPVCCELYWNVSSHIIALAKENEKLSAENKILYELAQKDEYYSKTLRLFGKYPTEYYPTPKDFAQNHVKEKLLLNDVLVTEAKTIPDDGISFKVDKLSDKIKIIMAATKRLEGSRFQISW